MANKQDNYDLNDRDSSKKFRDFVQKDIDRDPIKKRICDKVHEFNKCQCPRTKDEIRQEIEKLDKERRQKELEKLRD